jgi:hypothetical protein
MARIITLSVSTGDPTEEADQIILYSKDDGGVIKPYVILSDGTVVELSGGGGGVTLDDVRDAIGDTESPLLGEQTVDVAELTVGDNGAGDPPVRLYVNEGEVDIAKLEFGLSTDVSATGNLQITSQGTSELRGVNSRLSASDGSGNSEAMIFLADSGFDTGVRIRDYSDDAIQVSQIQVARGNGVTIMGTTDSCMLTLENGGSAAVAPASTGRIRYNSTGQQFEVSTNAGAYKSLNAPFGATGYVTLDTATEKTIVTVELPSVAEGASYAVDFNFRLPQPVGEGNQGVNFLIEAGDESVTYFSIGAGGSNAGNRHYGGRVIISFGPVSGPDQNVMRSNTYFYKDADDDGTEHFVDFNGPELIATPIDQTLVITIEIDAAADTGEEQVAHATITRLS